MNESMRGSSLLRDTLLNGEEENKNQKMNKKIGKGKNG